MPTTSTTIGYVTPGLALMMVERPGPSAHARILGNITFISYALRLLPPVLGLDLLLLRFTRPA